MAGGDEFEFGFHNVFLVWFTSLGRLSILTPAVLRLTRLNYNLNIVLEHFHQNYAACGCGHHEAAAFLRDYAFDKP
jgi:hypothetical protein